MYLGRIIKGVGGLYFVACNNTIYECSARGKFRKSKTIPTVGDYVDITVLDEETKKGSIEKINNRKNILIRPRVSNIDCAIITFATVSPDINFDLLDRFLIMAECQKIPEVVICINKDDLANSEDIKLIKDIYSPIYSVIYTSAHNNKGIDEVMSAIKGKVSVFAGPSGVGKSSLINCIIPEGNLRTGVLSQKIERGKHTTRQVELMEVCEDTYIVDSPGFTSLSLEELVKPEELVEYFREFKPYLGECRFNDCSHIKEPECAIKEHVGDEISKERYERFVFFYNELKQRRQSYD